MEIVTLCEALPSAKRAEVTDFARFLLERSTGSYGFDSTNSTPPLTTSMPKRKPPAAKVSPKNSPATLKICKKLKIFAF